MAATRCTVCQFRAISDFLMEQPRADGLPAIGINFSFFCADEPQIGNKRRRGIMKARGIRLALWSACIIFGALPCLHAADIQNSIAAASFRIERTEVSGGAELLTLLSSQPSLEDAGESDRDIPVLSVLRDTLGDADPVNDRLRQVWVYSYAKPSVWQRFVACLPFLYRQASPQKHGSSGPPRTVVDLSAPHRNTMYRLLGEIIQAEVLDEFGVAVRLASRSYMGNARDYRDLQIYQALLALSDFGKSSTREEFLTPEDMEVIGARLSLSTRRLGGMVSERYLQAAWDKENLKSNQNRGHNWELLRQQAEKNGLYFEPLSFEAQEQQFALLWIDQALVAERPPKSFNKKFLGISNPFADKRLLEWDGYAQTWHFDADGARVADGEPSARAATMIPLALYALDHPRVPLLLVDMRQAWKPGTKERARRIATDLMTDVLRLTRLSSWQFAVGKSAFFFVKSRQGSALNRSARLRAYAQLQRSLKIGISMDRELHDELARRSQRLGLNPFDRRPAAQVDLAKGQHAALLAFARSPEGLPARLEKDRAAELHSKVHSAPSRVLLRAASLATFGLYRPHREQVDVPGYAALDQYRRFSYHRRLLERAVGPETQPDVAWSIEEVRRSLNVIFELGEKNSKLRPAAEGFVSDLCRKTENEDMERQCAERLTRFQDLTEPVKSVFTARHAAGAEPVFTRLSTTATFR